MSTNGTLSIGDVASGAGVRVETVRYYEREGLIPRARRDANGYRRFPPDAVAHIRLIQSAQALGFSLKEIGELLVLKTGSGSRCRSVRERTLSKLDDIDRKIETLQRMKAALLPLVEACRPEETVDHCPILNALDRGEIKK